MCEESLFNWNLQNSFKLVSHSNKHTFNLAREFSKFLKPGSFVALFGGLGVGKTVFVKGLANGLGYDGEVVSPTFSLINEYVCENLLIVHCDMYRVNGYDELISSGFFDYLNGKNLVIVEWSENIVNFIPDRHYEIYISYDKNNDRLFEFKYIY